MFCPTDLLFQLSILQFKFNQSKIPHENKCHDSLPNSINYTVQQCLNRLKFFFCFFLIFPDLYI